MDTEKYKFWKRPAQQESAESKAYAKKLEEMALEIENNKKAVKSVVRSRGWKIIEQYLDVRVNRLKEKLVDKDCVETRAAIKEVRALFQFLNSHLVD